MLRQYLLAGLPPVQVPPRGQRQRGRKFCWHLYSMPGPVLVWVHSGRAAVVTGPQNAPPVERTDPTHTRPFTLYEAHVGPGALGVAAQSQKMWPLERQG